MIAPQTLSDTVKYPRLEPSLIPSPRLTLHPFAITVQRLAGQKEVAAMTMNIPHPYPALAKTPHRHESWRMPG